MVIEVREGFAPRLVQLRTTSGDFEFDGTNFVPVNKVDDVGYVDSSEPPSLQHHQSTLGYN